MPTRSRRFLVPAIVLAASAVAGAQAMNVGRPPGGGEESEVPRAERLLEGAILREAREEREAPEDFYLFSRIRTGGAATRGAFTRAGTQAAAVGRQTQRSSPGVAGRRWNYVGPSNIGARVVDIVADPELKNTIYVASASGGVWKSTDAGRTFTRIWSNRRTQSMGALTMAQDETLYAGTGETNPGGGSLTYGGDGIYKSSDRGRTWRNVGLRGSSTIGRIVVDPTDPNHVLVAVSGNLFTPGGQRGLYETTDGGRTWDRILRPPNPTTGAVDVVVDPKDPDNIFVAMWDHIRYPDVRRYTGAGSGIWRSTNGGRSFDRLGPANGLPPPSEDVGGRIGLAMDPRDPDRLYAVYANNKIGSFAAWFTSSDGGDTWIAPPAANANLEASQSVYGWWFGRVWVDPRNSEHVYVAGLLLAESFDGGQTFPTLQAQQHVDHHAMAWDPHDRSRVYNGNDGGVYRSEHRGADATWIHGKVQPWSQFYTIDVSEQDPSRINGGLQDQGSVRSWGGRDWNQYYGGDGVENSINPTDKQHVFACSQYGDCGVSEDGGNTTEDFSCQQRFSTRCGWLTPIEFHPRDGDVVYQAGNVVARSPDRGHTWEAISPDLGEGDPGREINPLYANHYGTVQAIGLSRDDPDVIFAGTDNHRLWKTTDGGTSWRKISDPKLPDRWITHVEVSDENAQVLYVTFSGYRQGDDDAYVLRSRDGGRTWRDITDNLPEAPVNDLVLAGRSLYVASDVGVFARRTNGGEWLRLGSGLPLSPVNDLRFVASRRVLFAATFGRGIYKIAPPPSLKG
ncbi:MAG: WD40/YVTN/BNR-like repeat-containing protein [Actinomycetota bacterium]